MAARTVVFITLWIAAALSQVTAAMIQEDYPLQLVLTLKSYSAASGSNYYKCGSHSGNISMSMCGYRLQVEAASDGISVGYELFGKQVYREELQFEQRQETGYKNPVSFNLTNYPSNVTVTLTLHYYSTEGRKLNRVFHAPLSRVPLALMDDSTEETIKGAGWSSFAFSARLVCRPNNYGPFCGKYCLPDSPLEYCNRHGQLICRTTDLPSPCSTTTMKPTNTMKAKSINALATKTTMKPKTSSTTKTGTEPQPLPPPIGDNLGNTENQPIDPLVLMLLLCGALVAFLLLVSGLSAAVCMVGRKKQSVARTPPVTGSRPRPNYNQQQQQQPPPPPPMPLSSADCDMLQYHRQQQQQQQLLHNQRGSCSGSSLLCSASVAGGYEPLRMPDGAEMPNSGAPIGDGRCTTAGTLPIFRPPTGFQTDTARSVSRFGTGRNVRAKTSFDC